MDGDDLFAFAFILVVTALFVAIVVGLFAAIAAVLLLVALMLLPGFVVGFVRGVRQARRTSNTSTPAPQGEQSTSGTGEERVDPS